jgi:hypothetical protein
MVTELKKNLQEAVSLYKEIVNEVKTDKELAVEFQKDLVCIKQKIQKIREGIIVIEKASSCLPKDYFNETEEFVLPIGDPPNDIVDFLLGIVKSKINELATTLVENGPKIAKEGLKTIIRKKFSNIENDIIDSTQDAVIHYYTGNGRTVELGPNTIDRIKKSKDVDKYRKKIEGGLTVGPASGSGLGVDMTYEDTSVTFHLGSMVMSYKTTCDANNCTTTYTVDDDGFVDPNSIGYVLNDDDSAGPNNELGGTPYDYEPVTWSETFPNPGYPVKDGKPLPIKK